MIAPRAGGDVGAPDAARLTALLENSSELLAILDTDAVIRYVSPAVQRILGWSADTLLGVSAFDNVHPDDVDRMRDVFVDVARSSGATRTVEVRRRKRDGSWLYCEVTLTNPLDDPAVAGVLDNSRDISAHKQIEAELAHRATHDSLTDLPNRDLFHERLQQALRTDSLKPATLSLLLLDLDGFKDVNDTFGHQAGDQLLRQAAPRLVQAVRESDLVARLSGDEFAVLLPGTGNSGAVVVANKLLRVLEQPYTADGVPLIVGASIGIAVSPEHGQDITTLLRHADMAMYAARRGGTGYSVYVPEEDEHTPDRLSLVSELHVALENDELLLHFQPIVNFTTGDVRGIEAFLRWQHPQRGLLSANDFMYLAEQAGFSHLLARWVLLAAFNQVRSWHGAGFSLPVSVKLSGRNLQDEHFPQTLAELLRDHQMEPGWLCLEISERGIAADPEQAIDVFRQIREMGIRIALDDFGSGASSLRHLMRLPVEEIKLDRPLVENVATDDRAAFVAQWTIDLAHGLGMQVVAEGVEDEDTWVRLAMLGCDSAQGYYLCSPLPADELLDWLRRRD